MAAVDERITGPHGGFGDVPTRTQETLASHAGDPEGTGVYHVGGIAALILGVAYLVTIPLYAHVGAPPSGGAAWLTFGAGKTAEWWAILGLSILTDMLFVPVALALYRALNGVKRTAMRLATACVGLFVVLDLAVTWPNYAALIGLSSRYGAATGVQRAASVAAATYASAVLSSPLEAIYSILVLACGILLIGLVMRTGPFHRGTAYLGVATGLPGIGAGVSRVGVLVILTSILTTVWVLMVGYRLFRLGQS